MDNEQASILEKRSLRRILLPFTAGIAFIIAVTGGTVALY